MTPYIVTLGDAFPDSIPDELVTALTQRGVEIKPCLKISIGDIALSVGPDAALCATCGMSDGRARLALVMPAMHRLKPKIKDQRLRNVLASLDRCISGDDTVDLYDAEKEAYTIYNEMVPSRRIAGQGYALLVARALWEATRATKSEWGASWAAFHAFEAADAPNKEREQQRKDIIRIAPPVIFTQDALS